MIAVLDSSIAFISCVKCASVTVTVVGAGGVFEEDELDSPGLLPVAIAAQVMQVSAQTLE